jgi:hypothetical protein
MCCSKLTKFLLHVSKSRASTFSSHLTTLATARNDQPRSHEFIITLLHDVFYLVYHKVINKGELSSRFEMTVGFLESLLEECRQLLATPILRSVIANIQRNQSSKRKRTVARSRPRSRQHRAVWYRLSQERSRYLLLLGPRTRLLFYSNRPDAKNTWNNWLDTSVYTATGWVASQHEAPRIGHAMNLRKGDDFEPLDQNDCARRRPGRNGAPPSDS